MTKAILSRCVLILAVLMFVGAALTGCSGNTARHTIKVGNMTVDKTENALDQKALEDLAKLLVDTQSKTVVFGEDKEAMNLHTALVAAYRGYDVASPDYRDAALPAPQPDKAGTFAYNVLEEAQKQKGFESIDLVKYSKINAQDVATVVNALKTEVDVAGSGFIGTILNWVGVAFSWMINTLGFGSFILGSLFFAILVELVMLPISIKQQRNSRRQALLRPKEMAIRKKYAGRTDNVTMQKMQTEVQEMYQKEGFNPMTAGCMPMILSMIIILPLYYIVIDPVQYILGCTGGVSNAFVTFVTSPLAAGGLGINLSSTNGTIEVLSKVENLSLVEGIKDFAFFSNSADVWTKLQPALQKDVPSFSLFGINFGLTPRFGEPWALLAVPVLTFLVYFFSMKLNRKFSYQPAPAQGDKAAGCSNGMMDVMMPLFSVYITFIVPAAVGVYWVFKSIVGTIKQFIMSKAMPMPQFTEEDYKAAERELAGKEKKKPKKPSGTKNPNVRSLHHIDDEDFIVQKPETNGHGGVKKPAKAEDIAEIAEPAEAAIETSDKKEDKESSSALIEGVNLKDDSADHTETDK